MEPSTRTSDDDEHVDSAWPIVVCALEYERRLLRRSGLGRRVEIRCCGCGAEAIAAHLGRLDPGDRPVVLAGLAGGLDERLRPGDAAIIERVVDDRGRTWAPSLEIAAPGAEPFPRVVVTSVDATVVDPVEKRQVAERTGAELVDMEAVAFARIASGEGWRWAIVRGVSDAVDEPLPRDIATWVSERGRIRLDRVVASLARRPGDLISASRLRRSGDAAMERVTTLIENVIATPRHE